MSSTTQPAPGAAEVPVFNPLDPAFIANPYPVTQAITAVTVSTDTAVDTRMVVDTLCGATA